MRIIGTAAPGPWRNFGTNVTVLPRYDSNTRDVEIKLSEEADALLGTGGGIVKALPHFEGKPFFVHNSDSIWVEGIGHATFSAEDVIRHELVARIVAAYDKADASRRRGAKD